MFGKKAEMTGTTIRLPYLEKRAQTFRRGSVWWSLETWERESCEQMQSSFERHSLCCKTGFSLNRQFGWPLLGPEHAGTTLNYVIEGILTLLLLA